MNKLPPLKILVAATLLSIAAGNAWPEGATPGVFTGQTAAPGSSYVPGRYTPRPDRYRYAQPWSQPSQWPAPPPGYGQIHPYSRAYGQYPPGPAAAVEDPSGTELKQAQEQLAEKTTKLETTQAQLARLQTELQAATAALQKAQSDTINAGRQVDATMTEVDMLKKILCELAARIETRKSMLQNALQSGSAKPDNPDSSINGETESETATLAESQTDPQCIQLAPPPAITSGQRGITVKAQAR